MTAFKGRAAIRFTRGRRLFQIAPAYSGDGGFIGICDGRVLARAHDPAAVAFELIKAESASDNGTSLNGC